MRTGGWVGGLYPASGSCGCGPTGVAGGEQGGCQPGPGWETSETRACGSRRSTQYSAYDPETYSGHWKQLTVRTSRRGQAMAVVYFHPQVSGGRPCWGWVSGPGGPWHSLTRPFHHLFQKLSPEELVGLKASLAQHFMTGPGKASGVTCLYFVEEGQR